MLRPIVIHMYNLAKVGRVLRAVGKSFCLTLTPTKLPMSQHFRANCLPSIALESLAHIFSEGEVSVSINGDAVVIVESLRHSKSHSNPRMTLQKSFCIVIKWTILLVKKRWAFPSPSGQHMHRPRARCPPACSHHLCELHWRKGIFRRIRNPSNKFSYSKSLCILAWQTSSSYWSMNARTSQTMDRSFSKSLCFAMTVHSQHLQWCRCSGQSPPCQACCKPLATDTEEVYSSHTSDYSMLTQASALMDAKKKESSGNYVDSLAILWKVLSSMVSVWLPNLPEKSKASYCCKVSFGSCQADSIGDTHSKRSSRPLSSD